LWVLFMFELWNRTFIDGANETPLRARDAVGLLPVA
jgi:hypothetical protein